MTDLVSKRDIVELEQQNPWWVQDGAELPESFWPRVGKYPQIWHRLTTNNLIVAVVGLRRVGKTTILRQLASDLISKEKVEESKILFFSFEETPLKQNAQHLAGLIEYQMKRHKREGKLWFLLDEIQYVDGWNSVLKKYWDLYPDGLKFVVSGSSSLFIRTQARESLAGRILESQVFPWSFGDFLKMRYGLEYQNRGLLEPVTGENEAEMRKRFDEYLRWGEFPALFKLPGDAERREYVKSWIVGKVVEYDLPKYRRIIRGLKLVELAEVLAQRPGQIIELLNLAGDLQISRSALNIYLGLLEQTYLIYQVFNSGTGFRTRRNRGRKIYPSSVNLYAMQPEVETGLVAETYVANYLHRAGENFYYWREREGREVDFVVKRPKEMIAVEVKYQSRIRDTDLKNLAYFCKKHRGARAVVVGKYPEDSRMVGGVKIGFVQAHHLM